MSLFAKILKNAAVGAANGAYGIYRDTGKAIQKQVDFAKMEDLLEKQKAYEKQIAHFSPDEQAKMMQMAKNFAMVDLAKGNAKDNNTLERLKHKYGLLSVK